MGETSPGIYEIIETKPTRDGRLFVELSTRPPVIAGELVLDLRRDHASAEGASARVFGDGRAEVLPLGTSTPIPVRATEIGYLYPECERCGRDDTEVVVYDPGREYWPEHDGHVWEYECEHCGEPVIE